MQLGPLKEPVDLLKRAAEEFGEDNGTSYAAALAYYSLISFFPLLLVLVALVGYALSLGLPEVASARNYVINQVSSAIPTARPLLEQSFQETAQRSGLTGLVGLLTGIWAASNIFAQLDKSFDVIFGVDKEDEPLSQKIWTRLRAVLIVLLLAVLLIASVVVDAVLGTAQTLIAEIFGSALVANLLNLGVSLLITIVIFTALYRYLPNGRVTWRAALVGGVFTAVTWAIGRQLLSWYLSTRQVPSAGEIVATVLAFVALIYYFGLILLFGGELSATYQRRLPSAPPLEKEEEAPPVQTVPRHQPHTFLVGLLTGIGLAVVTVPSILLRRLRRRLE